MDEEGQVRPEGAAASGRAAAGPFGAVQPRSRQRTRSRKSSSKPSCSSCKNAGFIRSRKGKGGGYTLAMPPAEIRIGEVVRALEGPLAPIACASRNFYRRCEDCPDEERCAIHMLTVDVRNAIADVHGQHHGRRHARAPATNRSGAGGSLGAQSASACAVEASWKRLFSPETLKLRADAARHRSRLRHDLGYRSDLVK